MQLRGLHHVTAICRDLEATIAFYRDVLGLAIVHDGPSDDDPGTPPRLVRRGRRAGRDAALLHGVPAAAEGRDGRRLDAPLRARGRVRRGARGLARLPARARASSARTSTTAARSGRCTCATPTATWWRSPHGGRASPPAPADERSARASVASGPVVERERVHAHVGDGRRAAARRARAAGARSSTRRSWSPTSGSRPGTAGSACGPSDAGSSADRRSPCSRPPTGTRARPRRP